MKNIIEIKRFLSVFALAFVFGFSMQAQQMSLEQKLDGIEKVEDVMAIVDDHYAEIDNGIRIRTNEINYKHWARWAWYMSARTDGEGRIVDVQNRTNKALKSYKAENRSSNGSWSFMGPSSISGSNGSAIGIGRVDRIAFHPTDANTIYIGTTAGGVFKSNTGGTSWSSISQNLPSTAISGIVVNHANANNIFVLTGDGDASGGGFIVAAGYWRSSSGVFVSYDGGINWYPTGALPITGSYAGYALVQDPNNANILLAATDKGIYRTDNYGGSWTQVLSGRTYEIKYRPGNSSYVYATQNGKFYRSINGGVDWTQITAFDNAMPSGRVALAVTNALSNRVYLLSGWANGGSTFGGAYISYNYGASFTRQSNSPNIVESGCDGNGGNNQSSYDLALAVSHSSTSRVVAAGVSTWRSSNTGLSWSNASAGRCSEFTSSTGYVHADVHDIEYNPLNGHVFVCSDGGLIKSTNHGADWTNLSDGISASQIYHMAGSQTNTNNMMIGLQDNGTKRRNANSTVWDQVLSADGYDCIYNYGGSTTGYLSWNSQVNRFTGNGSSRTNITPPNSSGFFPRVMSAIDDPTLVLAGYNDIFRSTNSGSTWTNEGVAGNWDLERCPTNSNRFYAAGGGSAFTTTGEMWVSTDKGLNWTQISGNSGYPTANIRMTDICVRPNLSTNVWAVFGGFSAGNKVFFSSNAGSSWTNMSGTLPDVPVNAIAVDNGNNAYIGTDIGVFYRGSGMNDWVPFWHRSPIVPVTDLELYQNASVIRAATFGRGVWQSDTYSTCPANWVLFANMTGNRYYEVSDWISCNSTVYGGSNTNVVFKAAGHITLSPGFEVGFGNSFKAYIKPCGQADLE